MHLDEKVEKHVGEVSGILATYLKIGKGLDKASMAGSDLLQGMANDVKSDLTQSGGTGGSFSLQVRTNVGLTSLQVMQADGA